jgi:hypothetical protein
MKECWNLQSAPKEHSKNLYRVISECHWGNIGAGQTIRVAPVAMGVSATSTSSEHLEVKSWTDFNNYEGLIRHPFLIYAFNNLAVICHYMWLAIP